MRRELDMADISAHCNVGGVEFTTCTIAAQLAPRVRRSRKPYRWQRSVAGFGVLIADDAAYALADRIRPSP